MRRLKKFLLQPKPKHVAEAASSSNLTREKNGLFTLAEAAEGPAAIDIVAVHGLGGDAYGTWNEDGQLWLRDFLPHQIPRCRILTYGYESLRKLSSSITGINDIAADLLERLNAERTSEQASIACLRTTATDLQQEKTRPIIFICHSLGGIIFKKALVIANEQLPFYSHLLSKVHSVVFMGTPHRGTGVAFWGDFLARASFAADLGLMGNPRLLSDLRKNSPILADISQQFVHRGKDLHIRTFYEREKYKNTLVVDPDSAQLNLPNEKRIPIQANHKAMCKFSSADSQKYRPVLAAIKELAAAAEEGYRFIVSTACMDERDRQCLEDLRVTDPRHDKTRIEQTQGGLLADAYRWILDDTEFRRWRDDGQSRLLWVKGDPGKGKTMLLCGIIDDLKCTDDNNLLSFFFCQAADSRISSATAVLRGLIYLLVDQQPLLISHVRKKYDLAGSQLFEDINAWVALSEIFTNILEDPNLQSSYLIIDALDECQTGRKELLTLISGLAYLPSKRAKWIVSSCHRDDIEQGLRLDDARLQLSIELNAGHVSHAVELPALETGQRRHKQRRTSPTVPSSKVFETVHLGRLDDTDKAFLRSLWFPSMGTRLQDLAKPAEHTCNWLFHHQVYEGWFNSGSRDKYYGLLWLKGKPGAGKSVLMKEAFRRATLKQATTSDYCTAAFFFNAKGDELEKSPVGLFRSLLHQLLPIHPEHPQLVSTIWYDQILRGGDDGGTMPWQEGELKSIFEAMISHQSAKTRRMFIFIDALDECDLLSIRSQAYFWREITKSAYAAGVHLNVCLSSRPFRSVTVSDCPEIVIEDHNGDDIAAYVDQKFKLGIAAAEPRWKRLRKKILSKSAGVFLWVILVVDTILNDWEDGKGLHYLLTRLDVVPEALEDLFSQMFLSLNSGEKHLTVRLFQWAILSTKPLRLHEWHHILAFIRRPVPSSLQEWGASDYFTENDDQLERQIRSISKGLVEVKPRGSDIHNTGFETLSACAAAGSLDLEYGETRVVQVIHQSVREFFLWSNGFSVLDPNLESDVYGTGHLSIMTTCLDYLKIAELDALIQARARAAQSEARANWKASVRVRPRSPRHSLPRPPLSIPTTGRSVDSDRRLMPTQERQSQTEEESSRMEMLKGLFGSAPQIDIPRWMEMNQLVADGVLSESPRSSTTHLSVSCRSQVLEAYPALLSYATFELFSHARLADKKGTDPSPIISRLRELDLWDRWVTLREDIPQGIKLLDYAMSQDLSTWVHYSFGTGELTAPNVLTIGERIPGEGYGSNAEEVATLEDIRVKTRSAVTTTGPAISDEEDENGSFEAFMTQSNKRHSSITSLGKNTDDQNWVPFAEDWDSYLRGSDYSYDADEFWHEGSAHGSVASFGSAGSHTGRMDKKSRDDIKKAARKKSDRKGKPANKSRRCSRKSK